MDKIIKPIKITRSNFSVYGDLISIEGVDPININAGYAKRFDDLADLNTSKKEGKAIVSIFSSLKRTFPMKIDMMEKHPLGSQAFIPMKETTFLCFVAPPGEFPNINPNHMFKALGGLFMGLVFMGDREEPVTDKDVEKLLNQLITDPTISKK